MFQKKGITALFGAALLAVAVLAAPQKVKADDGITTAVDQVEAEAGSEVSVTIHIDGNFRGFNGALTYDTNLLERKGEVEYSDSLSKGMASLQGDKFGFVSGSVINGGSIKVTFQVKEGSCQGTPAAAIGLSMKYTTTGEAGSTIVQNPEGKVTIQHPKAQNETQREESTCTVQGYEKVICKACGDTISDTALPLAPHSWGDYTYASEEDKPTCTKEGTQIRTCTVCQAQDPEVKTVPKTAHTYEWKVVKEATCTAKGEKAGTCSVCQDQTTQEIPALGHSWKKDAGTDKDGWKVTVAATEEKEGTKERVCAVCEEKETAVIPKLEKKPAAATTPSGKNNTKTGSTTTTSKGVNTGDPVRTGLYGAIGAAALVMLCAIFAVQKKKKEQ